MVIMRLNLLNPLYYTPIPESDPFAYVDLKPNDENIFCFELSEADFLSAEPDREKLFARLVFCGKAALPEAPCEKQLELPRGNYLFTQKRKILSRSEIIEAAVETQREGLWQRLKPGKLLYLRYLFEDGKGVTQLFRPYD